MKRFFCLILLTATTIFAGFSQGTGSLSDLKKAYITKRYQYMDAASKTFTETEQAELNKLVEEIRIAGPATYEYYIVSYINGNYNTDLQENLFKAYELNPSDEYVLREMLGYYIMTENLAKQKEFVQKVQKTYTAAELDYYRDAMPGDAGSILVTSNQEDMYAFMAVQTVDGLGPSVKVICLDFLKNSTYKSSVASAAGISNITFSGAETSWLKTLITGSSKKVHVSTTVPQGYLSAIENNMVLTGLTYQYGSVNQRNTLDNFWSKLKSRDLEKFAVLVVTEQKLYSNYLPPLLTLYKLKLNEGTDDPILKTTILTIAEKTGKKDQVDKILTQYAGG
jgi:hypothetical protein